MSIYPEWEQTCHLLTFLKEAFENDTDLHYELARTYLASGQIYSLDLAKVNGVLKLLIYTFDRGDDFVGDWVILQEELYPSFDQALTRVKALVAGEFNTILMEAML